MAESHSPPTKKAPSILALRCLNESCRALLAYEVDADNHLYVDLAWTARQAGDLHYFPCPACHGKNVVEPAINPKGQQTHRVTRWEP